MEAPDNNACIELADPREVHRVHEIDFERFFSRECSVRFRMREARHLFQQYAHAGIARATPVSYGRFRLQSRRLANG